MERKFNVGDIVVRRLRNGSMDMEYGICVVRRIGEVSAGPYIAVFDEMGRGRAAAYESLGWEFYTPPDDGGKQSIDQGAEEYEQIMIAQEIIHGT